MVQWSALSFRKLQLLQYTGVTISNQRETDALAGRLGSARAWLVPLAIAAITLLAFVPALEGTFLNWDDERNFVANPHYRGLGWSQLRWMWSTFLLGHYIPLSWMSLGLDYSIWGMNPTGYHLTNVLLHSMNACLVFFVARRLFVAAGIAGEPGAGWGAVVPAAIAALLFSVHPLRVESVAWITERRDVLSGFFFLASALAYLRSVEQEERRPRAYWVAVALFVCAILSKATAITLPAALFILNVYPLRRIRWGHDRLQSVKRVVVELVPFAIPAVLAVVVSVVAVYPPFLAKFGLAPVAPEQLAALADNVSAQNQFGLAAKLAVSSFSFCFYLLKTFVPIGLSPLYEMPPRIDPLAGKFLVSYAAVSALVVACYVFRRRPALVAAAGIFFVTTLPMLGIVQNGPQIAADRYTYHAGPALSVLVAGVLWVALRRRRREYLALTGGAVVVLAALTWRQSTFWQNSERLWQRVLAVDSSSSLGHSAMASLRYRENRVDEGLAHSIRAIRLAPDFAEARNDYGVGLARMGQLEEAAAEYRRALVLKPRFDDAENNLGVLMMQIGAVDSAVAHYQLALAANPDNPDAEINLGNAQVRLGKTADAIAHYQRAAWIKPTSADAYHNWGVALARDGRLAEAIERFRRAVAIDSSHAEAKQYLDQAERMLRVQRP